VQKHVELGEAQDQCGYGLRSAGSLAYRQICMALMRGLPVVPVCRTWNILIFGNKLDVSTKSGASSAPSRTRYGGALRDRYERWARDAMDALATRAIIRADERR
jgi:hypothetical protein